MFLKDRQVSSFGCFVFEIWVLRASVFVFECFVFETTALNVMISILGDPGAVSRVGKKGGTETKVVRYGGKSPWVPTLTELFPKIQADTGS